MTDSGWMDRWTENITLSSSHLVKGQTHAHNNHQRRLNINYVVLVIRPYNPFLCLRASFSCSWEPKCDQREGASPGSLTSNDRPGGLLVCVQVPADHQKALPSPVSSLHEINSCLCENPSVFVMACGYKAPQSQNMEPCPGMVSWLQLLNYCKRVMLACKWTLPRLSLLLIHCTVDTSSHQSIGGSELSEYSARTTRQLHPQPIWVYKSYQNGCDSFPGQSPRCLLLTDIGIDLVLWFVRDALSNFWMRPLCESHSRRHNLNQTNSDRVKIILWNAGFVFFWCLK